MLGYGGDTKECSNSSLLICSLAFQKRVTAIDISLVDWAYKSSTCDVMYRRQRRHLYYGGQI
jgi:hypothetical protein